jgi:DNA-directed RNA polymerase subunit beta'
MIDRKTPEVWDILAEVTKGHPVFLNRAPTLHRLSIQAFEPKLIEGEAIRVHPLVCTAYNADFDGDQMAVHVPLSVEAQMEARQLMLAPNNIFSPASGRPITTPSQDIILGAYYLTWAPVRTQKDREKQEHLPLFENSSEVEFAIASRKVGYHQWIRIRNPNYGTDTVFGEKELKILETTPGRVRFNEIWPAGLGFINKTVPRGVIPDFPYLVPPKLTSKTNVMATGWERTPRFFSKLEKSRFDDVNWSGVLCIWAHPNEHWQAWLLQQPAHFQARVRPLPTIDVGFNQYFSSGIATIFIFINPVFK